MNFNYKITIDAEQEEDDPEELVMPLTHGIITKVVIAIPRGHAGLAHLKIFYHESQLYPLNRDGNYHGDRMDVTFEEYQPILVAPYELKARAWNEDEEIVHSFIMNFTVLRPEELERPVPETSIRAMEELIGEEIEV